MLQLTLPTLPKLTIGAVIDILVVAVLIYQFVLMIRGRRSAHILTGICTLVVVYLIAVWAHLELLRSVLAGPAAYSFLAVHLMFQAGSRPGAAPPPRVRLPRARRPAGAP